MAKREQIAVCQKVTTRKTKSGEKNVYTLVLEGKEFDVWESDYFSASEGMKFVPVIHVVPRAYLDKEGKPRSSMQAVVNWEAV